ncbi:MAG: choice-of-anchor tandem repeat NxxGxxAF-containing protein [Steroidobacteraceae bacterium]
MTVLRSSHGPLLASAGARLLIAAIAVLCLWCGVLWAYLAPPPTTISDRRPVRAPPSLHLVVASGQPAPAGGSFDRFDIAAQPIVTPVNARGHVAFYASVVRSKMREGIFLATGRGVVKVAGIGDAVPGAGSLSEFAGHPIPALNDSDKVAFGAAVAGARTTEGVFLASEGTLKPIALSGNDAPGIFTGTFVEFDAPAINNWDEVAFVATVRRGRETFQALYLYSGGKLRKLVAEGDRLPPPNRGTFDKFGVPAINNKGVVAFPAVLEHAAVLGGIFLAGTRDLRLLLSVGDLAPSGAMLVRFSERVAINDEDNVALGAQLRSGDATKEAILLVTPSGLVEVAGVGDSAPGGGTFAAFGPWPSLGPGDMVAFVASIDGGPGALGLYAGSSAANLRRVAMVGDHLPNGKVLPSFAINPVASAGSNGGLTFATMAEPGAGENGIYYFGPPANTD